MAVFLVCLAPVAVAMDGGTVLTGFRKGVSATFKAPVGTVLVVGSTVWALIMLNMLRLGFSASAAQHGFFSFGVQGAAAVISTVIVACAGVALTLIYQRAAGR